MKTMILGMGNPILSDDGVGLYVVRQLKERIPEADAADTLLVGLGNIDLIEGYDHIFLVDALTTGKNPIGNVCVLPPGEGTMHLFSSHGLDFFELIELGKASGLKMPEVAAVYGIEIGVSVDFSEEFTPPIQENLESIVSDIEDDIRARMKRFC